MLKKRVKWNTQVFKKFKERVRIFEINPEHPILRDHSLSGKLLGYRAFSITGDYRIVYSRDGNDVDLENIGTHNQVYK